MKNIQMIVLVFSFFFSASVLFAQDYPNEEIPEGMEAIPLGGGGGQIIVPIGSKTKQVGAQIIVEGTKEYMARMVAEMKERMNVMEKNQEALKQEIESLKKIIEELQKNSTVAVVEPQ